MRLGLRKQRVISVLFDKGRSFITELLTNIFDSWGPGGSASVSEFPTYRGAAPADSSPRGG